MIHTNTLAAKVAARNAVNRFANEWYAKAVEALKPFIGQKICKVDDTLLKKVKEALPEFPWSNQTQGFYRADRYTLKFDLKTHECSRGKGGPDYSVASYADQILYLGDLTDGVLTQLYDAPNFKTDYTEEFIVQTREAVRQAETALNKVRNSLGDFGMWDQ